jgi:predicted TIM-barrel fold metal-dependent hydrolase
MTVLDLDVVDPHHHLWDLSENRYDWLQGPLDPDRFSGENSSLRHDYLLADYLADVGDIRLAGSVHVDAGAADGVREARWVQGIADAAPFPMVIVAGADLSAGPAVLDPLVELPGMRGVRQILNWDADPRYTFTQRDDLLRDPFWQSGFVGLGERGLSFDLQIYSPQVPDAVRLIGDHPEIPVIVNHTLMPTHRPSEPFVAWRDGIRALAALPHVSAKISGLGMSDHGWTVESIRPYVLETIDAFGPDRAMFASNFPVDGVYADFPTIYAAFDALTADLPRAEREALFAGTARRVYRIPTQKDA